MRDVSRAVTLDRHYGADCMEKDAAFFKGLWNAGKAALNSTKGSRLADAKDAFTAATKGEGHNTSYNIGRVLYNTPERVFGTMMYGDWGAGAGLHFLGKRLGATGKWITDGVKKPVWEYDAKALGSEPLSWNQRLGNKLYEWGNWGVGRTNAAAERAKAAADEIINSGGAGHWALGQGLKWGTSVGVAAPLAAIGGDALTSSVFGDESTAAKAVRGVNSVIDAPFKYLNPFGVALTGATAGLNWVSGKVKENAVNVAESAAHKTADEISDAIRDRGRMAFLYGALSPEAYVQKLRGMAHQSIADKIAETRRAAGL